MTKCEATSERVIMMDRDNQDGAQSGLNKTQKMDKGTVLSHRE